MSSTSSVMGDFTNQQPFTSFMTNFPVSGQQKMALQFAFYNTLLFSLLGICLASIFAVYRLLYLFLMPMLWALLVGTVLFPLKRMISANLKDWLDRLYEENRPLAIGVLLLPVQFILRFSFSVYEMAFSFTGVYLVLGYFALKILCHYGAFYSLLFWFGRIYAFTDSLIEISSQNWVFVLVVCYALAFGVWIYLHEIGQINKKFARLLSVPIWYFLLAYLSNLLGFLRVLVFSTFCSTLVLISTGFIGANLRSEDESPQNSEEGNDLNDNETTTKKEKEDNVTTAVGSAFSESQLDQAFSSDVHLRIIGGLCALWWLVNHDFLLYFFVIIPFGIALIVQIGDRIGFFSFISQAFMDGKERITRKTKKFVHVIVAGPLRKFVYLAFTSERVFVYSFRNSVDLFSSIIVMTIFAVGCVFALLFTLYQLHSETLHLVKLGSNVLSSNPEWLRGALNYTEDHLTEKDIDAYMEQAYQQGRTWLASNIRQLADPKDPARADRLEDQAKLLVDNLYQLWEARRVVDEPYQEDLPFGVADGTIKRGKRDAGDDEHERDTQQRTWFAGLVRNANLAMWKAELTAMVSQNIETVWTIAHSIWHILLANLSLLSTFLVSVLSLLVEFSFDLLNFLLEWLVFITSLFYLLSNSSDQWLPIRLVSSASAYLAAESDAQPHNNLDVANAAEKAIQRVFLLSAKMAIFYGLYTFFVHSLFSLNVIIIPSILAALLAAIPIFPIYFVALFGVVELFFVRGQLIAALVFVAASLAPRFFVDSVFYREIKGSHPYLTGLAVVGGICWLGLQGAIIGPIILCLMIALINVYSQFAGDQTPRLSSS